MLYDVIEPASVRPAKLEIFKTETDFRLENCLSCTKPKLAEQKLFFVVGLAMFFPLQI